MHHGKRTDDKTWCAMVIGFLDLLIFHMFYNLYSRGCESRICSCWRSGFENDDISVVLQALEQTLGHHGFCEL